MNTCQLGECFNEAKQKFCCAQHRQRFHNRRYRKNSPNKVDYYTHLGDVTSGHPYVHGAISPSEDLNEVIAGRQWK